MPEKVLETSAAAPSSEYERGYDDALLQIGELIGWGLLGLGQNQGGAWLYENHDVPIGTAPITGERARALYEERRERVGF